MTTVAFKVEYELIHSRQNGNITFIYLYSNYIHME